MMGEGWVTMAKNIYPTDSDISAQDIPNRDSRQQNTALRVLSGASLWKAKADVQAMQACCGDTFYILQKDPIREHLDVEIQKDVPRTFPHERLFSLHHEKWSIGHQNLYKVLRAYSAMDPEVGYCQGMNFLASMPLFFLPLDESFWVFNYMMHELGWREYFTARYPRLHKSMQILNKLTAIHLPELSAHLKANNIHSSTYATFAQQWFMTCFTYTVKLQSVIRIWDMIFTEGHDYAFAVALTLLQSHSKHMLTLFGQDLQEYVLTFAKDVELSPAAFKTTMNNYQMIKPSISRLWEASDSPASDSKPSPLGRLSSRATKSFSDFASQVFNLRSSRSPSDVSQPSEPIPVQTNRRARPSQTSSSPTSSYPDLSDASSSPGSTPRLGNSNLYSDLRGSPSSLPSASPSSLPILDSLNPTIPFSLPKSYPDFYDYVDHSVINASVSSQSSTNPFRSASTAPPPVFAITYATPVEPS
jgi:hypothetical protein